jgi:hypothetical protein
LSLKTTVKVILFQVDFMFSIYSFRFASCVAFVEILVISS